MPRVLRTYMHEKEKEKEVMLLWIICIFCAAVVLTAIFALLALRDEQEEG